MDTLTARDIEYRRALGLSIDEPLPSTLGSATSGGGYRRRSKGSGGFKARPKRRNGLTAEAKHDLAIELMTRMADQRR